MEQAGTGYLQFIVAMEAYEYKSCLFFANTSQIQARLNPERLPQLQRDNHWSSKVMMFL